MNEAENLCKKLTHQPYRIQYRYIPKGKKRGSYYTNEGHEVSWCERSWKGFLANVRHVHRFKTKYEAESFKFELDKKAASAN